jgi:hypothetical protein
VGGAGAGSSGAGSGGASVGSGVAGPQAAKAIAATTKILKIMKSFFNIVILLMACQYNVFERSNSPLIRNRMLSSILTTSLTLTISLSNFILNSF